MTVASSIKKGVLTRVTPSWAAQTDTVSVIISGANTHFNFSTDSKWFQNTLDILHPFSFQVNDDTTSTIKIALNQSNLPINYTLHYLNKKNKEALLLENCFTVIGSVNVTSLIDVNPEQVLCNTKSDTTLVLNGSKTNFISDIDTMFIAVPGYSTIIYPKKMEIIDDTTISVSIFLGSVCDRFDIFLRGKINYVLSGILRSSSFISVDEVPKKPFLKVFPNPSEGIFTLSVNEDFEQASLNVFDMYGKIIITLDKLESSTQINLSEYAAGIYFVKLVKGNIYETEKIIKQ